MRVGHELELGKLRDGAGGRQTALDANPGRRAGASGEDGVEQDSRGLVSGGATWELDEITLGNNNGELNFEGDGGKEARTACPSQVALRLVAAAAEDERRPQSGLTTLTGGWG